MKALITGAGGFLGSRLCTALLEKGWEVVGIGRHAPPVSLSKWRQLKWICRDLSLQGPSSEELNGVDVLFHLAALLANREPEDEARLLRENEEASFRLFKACIGKVKRVVLASTQMVYGDPDSLAVDEEFPLDAYGSTYGLSKFHTENWLRWFQKKQGGMCISLRMTGFVEGPDSFIHHLNQAARENRVIEVYSEGRICRDYLAVQDAVQAFLAAAVREPSKMKEGLQVYNIGAGQIVTTLELAHLVCRETNSRSTVIPVLNPAPRSNFVFKIEKARRDLEFSPVSLSEAVRAYVREWNASSTTNL